MTKRQDPNIDALGQAASPTSATGARAQRSRRQFTMGALASVTGAFILAACGKDDGKGTNTSGEDSGSSTPDDTNSQESTGDGSNGSTSTSNTSTGDASSSTPEESSESSSSTSEEESSTTGDPSTSAEESTSGDTSETTDSSESTSDTSETDSTTSNTDDEIPGQCTIYPEQQEGPYYDNRPAMVRSDITEGLEGTPLDVEIRLLNSDGCTPIPDIDIDIWHADVRGVYSEYPNMLGGVDASDETFLRGRQTTDKNGWVRYKSIYPGWYPGRTTHIHFKVLMPGMQEVISQMYFPEDLSAEIYATGPYADHGPKDTSNAADGVIQQDNNGVIPPLAVMTKKGDGYVAKLLVTVVTN